jgi:hypothetical protein
MASGTVYVPGQVVPISGQYNVVDVYRRYLGRQVTCVRGERFPPTRTPREHGYVLADVTVHRSR